MKSFLFLFLLFSITISGQVVPNRNGYVHPLVSVQSGTNLSLVSITGYKGVDTFVITQNTSSWLLDRDSGLSWAQPLVFINATGKKIVVTGGVGGENCKYIKIIGFGSDSAYGFEFRGGGVSGNFQGMQKGILIEGCRFTGGSSGPLWVKEEAPHACDFYNYWLTHGTAAEKAMYGDPYKYLAPYYQDSIWVIHCLIDSAGGDAYFGSTGGIDGRDAVPCLGNQHLPTMQIHNFHFDSNYVNYLGRSVQLSIATGGSNTVNDNIMTNLGYEWAETGGAQARSQGGLRFGSGDVNTEVARNYVKYTNIYNYDLEEPNINFHNNYGDSCNGVFYHGAWFSGGQLLSNVIAYASHTQSSPLVIRNNKMYHSSAGGGINYAIYGGGNFNQVNDTCFNVGKLSVLSTPFVANALCTGGDTTCRDSTYSITHDSLELGHFSRITAHDSTVTNVDTVYKRHFKNSRYTNVHKVGTVTYTYYDTSYYDSAYIVLNGATHDTTVLVCNVSVKIGVMPYDSAIDMGIRTSRKVLFTSTWNGSGSPYTDTILLNIDYSSSHTFTTDTATFKTKCIDMYNAFQPAVVIVENEEVIHGSILQYCNELKAAAHGLLPLGAKVTNGGFIQPHLWYWYYSKTHDAQFLQYNFFRQSQRDSLVAGQFQNIVDSVEFEMQLIMSLNLYAVDVHYYIGNINQVSGIIRMLNYLSGYTAMPLILTEAGIFTSGLLSNVITIARSTPSTYLILYDGNDAGGNALNFSSADYFTAIQ